MSTCIDGSDSHYLHVSGFDLYLAGDTSYYCYSQVIGCIECVDAECFGLEKVLEEGRESIEVDSTVGDIVDQTEVDTAGQIEEDTAAHIEGGIAVHTEREALEKTPEVGIDSGMDLEVDMDPVESKYSVD